MWQYATVIHEAGLASDDVDPAVMPLHHCAQLDVFLATDLILGCTCVLLASPSVARIQAAITRCGITRMFATPSKWIELLHAPIGATDPLAHLTKGCFGAAPMPVPVLHELAERAPNLRMYNFYGQTEMAPAATVLGPDDQLTYAGSVGVPGINVDLAILDDASHPVADGVVGEICFRSPQACLGYLGDEAATQRLFRGGWLHTGDVGYRSHGGRLWFVDRIKDTVNVDGQKVASLEVEECIYAMPGVAECAVFAMPDPRTVEAVVAVVSPREGASLTPDAVRDHVRAHLAGFKTPRRVVVIEALPKNASGKILKRLLREQYANGSI
jgi:fatty-acyl-CoA synthase